MRPVTLAVLILICTLSASAADVIRVTASCPGADALTLDDTVLFPIFQMVNGIDGLARIETEAQNDGRGTLSVYFLPSTDLNLAEVRVQNRVNLALPALPDSCRQRGISVQKLPAGPPQFWLALTSTDADHEEKFLNNFALQILKPELMRVLGVTGVRIVGTGDIGMQVLLNPNSLAAHKLMPSDVIGLLRRQSAQVGASGAISGPQSHDIIVAEARLMRPAQFESVILRANLDGKMLRLKDVAEVGLTVPWRGFARVDGRPAALIEITAWPGQVTADQLLTSGFIDGLAPGMSVVCIADRSADRLLSVEVRLPGGSTLKQTEEVIKKTTELISGLSGKPSYFAFAEEREPNSAMIFVKSHPKSGPTATDVDKAITGISGAKIRVGDVPPGEPAFPARITLIDPGERDHLQFLEAAERVLATLAKDKNVVGPATFPLPPAPQRAIKVNRETCAQLGVELDDVFTTLQTSVGGVDAPWLRGFGTTNRVSVQIDPQFARFPEDLTRLMVRGASGEMVSLDKLIKIQETTGLTAVVRVNGYRSIVITAAPAAGKSSAEVAAKCVKLAQKALPREYRAIDLTGP